MRTAAGGTLAVEQIFWDPPISHAANMSEPEETALPKQCVKTGESSAGEHLIVSHLV